MTDNDSLRIPVVVAGALGRMGKEVIRAIDSAENFELVGAVEASLSNEGESIKTLLGLNSEDVLLTSDLEGCLCSVSQAARQNKKENPVVLVDFTHPSVVYEHTRAAIAYGVNPVIGTTGLTTDQLEELAQFAEKACIGTAVIPNFSIGMVLLQQAAAVAAGFYDHAELTELHHNRKADAPSGTCIKTAEMMEEIDKTFNSAEIQESESLTGSRGGLRSSGLRIHSVRLPGLVAHQEVIFGSKGETYTLRHDTLDRAAYMPGVLLTIRKVRQFKGLVYGLERVL